MTRRLSISAYYIACLDQGPDRDIASAVVRIKKVGKRAFSSCRGAPNKHYPFFVQNGCKSLDSILTQTLVSGVCLDCVRLAMKV